MQGHVEDAVDGKTVVAVASELIFTEDWRRTCAVVEHETPEWLEHNQRWLDLPIGRLWPHQRLYEFFRGNRSTNGLRYLDWHRNNFLLRGVKCPYPDQQLLAIRFEQFQAWNRLLWREGATHPEFVLDAKFDATRRVFMLRDGHHRSAFLRTAGVRHISLQVPDDELEAWYNRAAVQPVKDVIAAQSRHEFYTPILHPEFYGLNALREDCYRSRLDWILEFLGPLRIHGRLVDIGSNTGYFAHHFRREGVEVVGFDPDRNHYDLAVALSRLYQLDVRFENKPFEEADVGERFSGALLLTVLYHFLAQDKHRPLLEKLDQTVEDFVIWESGSDAEEEKAVIRRHTKFSRYQKIANTYGTGRVRELGIFFTDTFARVLNTANLEHADETGDEEAEPIPMEKGRNWLNWFR